MEVTLLFAFFVSLSLFTIFMVMLVIMLIIVARFFRLEAQNLDLTAIVGKAEAAFVSAKVNQRLIHRVETLTFPFRDRDSPYMPLEAPLLRWRLFALDILSRHPCRI